MNRTLRIVEQRQQVTPAILVKAQEESAQRLMMAYALTGLFFMLLPGTFLGVWNLISISGKHGTTISAAWIQAHGHAQIFGWIGTFIMGIGFYSIPKMMGQGVRRISWGWIAWTLWTSGALLRWVTGVYQWHWRATLPLSALLEFCAFLIFLQSVRRHRPANGDRQGTGMPTWIISVFIGTIGLGLGLLMNLVMATYLSEKGATPAFPAAFESRLLALLGYAFIVPTIWGFSARWLPVFLGTRPIREGMLRLALVLSAAGVVLAEAGLFHIAPWLFAIAAVMSVSSFHLFAPTDHAAKTSGVHVSFPIFVRPRYDGCEKDPEV